MQPTKLSAIGWNPELFLVKDALASGLSVFYEPLLFTRICTEPVGESLGPMGATRTSSPAR
jgi:hypothetical protein